MSTSLPIADVLLIDTDANRRELLLTQLKSKWNARAVSEIPRSVQLDNTIALLVADDDAESTIRSFSTLKNVMPAEKIGIISTVSVDTHLEDYFHAGARQFLSGAGRRIDRELQWQVRAMLASDYSLPLEQLFGSFTEARVFLVRDRWERQESVERTVDFFADTEFPDGVVDIQLALDEMLNNALYHSFRDGGPEEKYTAETFDALEADETVTVQVARDSDYNIVSVSDSAGSLAAETVTHNLARHLTMQGLMDEHGRGFFLMRSVSDGMLIRIQPGIRSEVTLIFGRHSNALVKSLLIRTVS